jgi:hypothetical protein
MIPSAFVGLRDATGRVVPIFQVNALRRYQNGVNSWRPPVLRKRTTAKLAVLSNLEYFSSAAPAAKLALTRRSIQRVRAWRPMSSPCPLDRVPSMAFCFGFVPVTASGEVAEEGESHAAIWRSCDNLGWDARDQRERLVDGRTTAFELVKCRRAHYLYANTRLRAQQAVRCATRISANPDRRARTSLRESLPRWSSASCKRGRPNLFSAFDPRWDVSAYSQNSGGTPTPGWEILCAEHPGTHATRGLRRPVS